MLTTKEMLEKADNIGMLLGDNDAIIELAIEMADKIRELRISLLTAKNALVYHQEQTRPIHSTGEVITAINKALEEQ